MTFSGPEVGLAGIVLLGGGVYLVQGYLRCARSALVKHPLLLGGLLALLLAVAVEALLHRYGVFRLNKAISLFCSALLFPIAYVAHREIRRELGVMSAQEAIRLRREAIGGRSRPNPTDGSDTAGDSEGRRK
jgi:hypothetical protein